MRHIGRNTMHFPPLAAPVARIEGTLSRVVLRHELDELKARINDLQQRVAQLESQL